MASYVALRIALEVPNEHLSILQACDEDGIWANLKAVWHGVQLTLVGSRQLVRLPVESPGLDHAVFAC